MHNTIICFEGYKKVKKTSFIGFSISKVKKKPFVIIMIANIHSYKIYF